MKNVVSIFFLLLISVIMISSCVTADFSDRVPEVEQSQFTPIPEDLRNYRYGEILPIFRSGFDLYIEVYNTIGANTLPADLWEKIDADKLANDLGAEQVLKNGPRYWVINGISGGGETLTGKWADFGGIEMKLVAVLRFSVSELQKNAPYQEKSVYRTTTYTYLKDNRVYELVSPEGDIYRMQAYSQIVDPDLTIDDLENLGDRLELPPGWEFRSYILEEDSYLSAHGEAIVIQDEFQNTYQKITK